MQNGIQNIQNGLNITYQYMTSCEQEVQCAWEPISSFIRIEHWNKS
jgi:hypothetical protein